MADDSQSVLITGGSYGLGLALAAQFLARGHKVVICGRDLEKIKRTRAAYPSLIAIQADITKAEDRARLLEAATAEAGPPAILINNAAVCHAHDYTSAFTLAADRARHEIETNFAAPVELIRLFLAQRAARKSRLKAKIVNISTPGALFPLEANPLYCASKAGFHIFTLALRRQLKNTPVQVIEVFPPALDTGLAVELDVDSQAANGPDVIARVAQATVDGILGGQETILPHEQAAALVHAIGGNVEAVADMANKGVRRRADWHAHRS